MKMSNVQVARLVGLSPATISRLRNGERPPTLENMRAIEKAFDWPVTQQVGLVNVPWPDAWEAAMVEWRELEDLVATSD